MGHLSSTRLSKPSARVYVLSNSCAHAQIEIDQMNRPGSRAIFAYRSDSTVDLPVETRLDLGETLMRR